MWGEGYSVRGIIHVARALYTGTQLPVEMLSADRRRNINLCSRWAETNTHSVIFLNDAHKYEDFARLHEPVHAVRGTQQCELMDWVYMPQNAMMFIKRHYNGTSTPEFLSFMKSKTFWPIFVCGTSTGVCVRYTIEGLQRIGFTRICVIEDACADLFPARHADCIHQWQSSGLIRVINTTSLLQHVTEKQNSPGLWSD